MSCRTLFVLAPVALLILLLSLVQASGFDAWVTPNYSIVNGTQVTFNITINNTNQTLNITYLNITLPSGFVLVEGSNKTSANGTSFQNSSSVLGWLNQTTGGFITNLTQEWFSFNSTVSQSPGDYNLTVTVEYSDSSTNQTNLTVTIVDCNSTLSLSIALPSGTPVIRGDAIQVMGYIEDYCGNPVENASVNWTISRGAMNWTVEHNQSNQSNGWYNLTWNTTSRPYGWYNLTMNATKPGFPGNVTSLENAFFIASEPNISSVGFTSLGTCPDTFEFWAVVTDSDNNYNNITLEVRVWNQSGQVWGSWQLANWSWQDSLSNTLIYFYPNFTNGSWSSGLYSYRFNSTDEFNYSDTINGTGNFTIYNCSRVFDIYPVPPTPGNGSYSNTSNATINITFTSPWYNATECILAYNNGTETNLTANASQGWCEFNITSPSEGMFNYSVWVHNSYTNISWNGTWYIGFQFICIEDWVYGSWGDCVDGIQTRTATDQNECGTYDNRLATSRSCEEDSGGGGGGGGIDTNPRAIKVFTSLLPGLPETMEISVSGIAVNSITLEASEADYRTSNLAVTGYDSKPSGITVPEKATVHSYLNITTTMNQSRLSRAIIEFSVEKQWLESRGVGPDSVALMRFIDNWTYLPTTRTGSDSEFHTYRSITSGFSWFVIAVRAVNVTGNETAPPEPGEEPGVTEPEQEPEEPEQVWEECTPGESQCVAGIIRQICNKWGTGWVNKETCYYGCRDGECSSTLLIEIEYSQLWLAFAIVIVLVALIIIYTKRRAIDDFLFWRL